MNAPLAQEVADLESRGAALQPHPQPDGWVYLVFPCYPLGVHFIPDTADLLIKIPPAYPFAGLDMFWTAADVRLRDGGMPANTSLEQALGHMWLRFSWHPSTWRQGVDNLTTYRAFINRRLSMGG